MSHERVELLPVVLPADLPVESAIRVVEQPFGAIPERPEPGLGSDPGEGPGKDLLRASGIVVQQGLGPALDVRLRLRLESSQPDVRRDLRRDREARREDEEHRRAGHQLRMPADPPARPQRDGLAIGGHRQVVEPPRHVGPQRPRRGVPILEPQRHRLLADGLQRFGNGRVDRPRRRDLAALHATEDLPQIGRLHRRPPGQEGMQRRAQPVDIAGRPQQVEPAGDLLGLYHMRSGLETFPRSPGSCVTLWEKRGGFHRDVTPRGTLWPVSRSSPRNNSGSSTRNGPPLSRLAGPGRKHVGPLLLHCGTTRQKAAEIVGVGRATVHRYVVAFREGGPRRLAAVQPPSPGAARWLLITR